MRELCCKKCGSLLIKQGEIYICTACGTQYETEAARCNAEELSRILDEQKQEAVANLKTQLWKKFNEEFYDCVEINRLAKGIKKYLPNDFFANFCDLASGQNDRELIQFLYHTDVVEYSEYVWNMLDFLMRPLKKKNLLAVNDLLTRAREAELNKDKFRHYNNLLKEKSKELDKGIYDVTIPRKVFVVYCSEDIEEVNKIVEALEEQNISCFVAARNLQHGAIQNYEEQLQQAMDNCKTILFVSSKYSRDVDRDTLNIELPYIKKKDIEGASGYWRYNYEKMPKEYKKPRVEYIVSEHTNTAADKVVEEFFAGYEYCYDLENLAKRILDFVAAPAMNNLKYCVACGAENGKRAKFCSECGKWEFVSTKEELEEKRRTQAEQAVRESEAVRKAEEEKKKAETEAASLRAELERLKAMVPAESQPQGRKESAEQIYSEGSSYYEKGDYESAVKFFLKAAEQGYANAQCYLGFCYEKGQGVEQSYTEAVKWYRKAAEQEYATAQNNLGVCYYEGQGVEQSYTEAVKWYRKAAEQEYATAQCNLGTCFYYGRGVEQSYTEAVKWYRKAAEQGYAGAQHNLGNCFYYGQGVEQNYAEAVKRFRKAAEQGYAAAQCNLGFCYAKGQGVEQNYTEAVKWYRKAVEQEYADAQHNLGVCYDKGRGVEQSYTEAVKWYRKAVEQGNATAQCNLGFCYAKGHGVEQSYTEAVKWYRKAAEQGNATAQNNLGVCYDKGRGVEQNYAEAEKWFRKAAEQGNATAQHNLIKVKV